MVTQVSLKKEKKRKKGSIKLHDLLWNSSSANRLWEITFLLLGSNLLPSSIRQFHIIVLRGGIWKNGSSVTGENHQLQIHNVHTQIVIDAVWTWEKCQEGPPTIIKIGFYFCTLKVICYHFLLQFPLILQVSVGHFFNECSWQGN